MKISYIGWDKTQQKAYQMEMDGVSSYEITTSGVLEIWYEGGGQQLISPEVWLTIGSGDIPASTDPFQENHQHPEASKPTKKSL